VSRELYSSDSSKQDVAKESPFNIKYFVYMFTLRSFVLKFFEMERFVVGYRRVCSLEYVKVWGRLLHTWYLSFPERVCFILLEHFVLVWAWRWNATQISCPNPDRKELLKYSMYKYKISYYINSVSYGDETILNPVHTVHQDILTPMIILLIVCTNVKLLQFLSRKIRRNKLT
jgi:hypothetical protein